MQAEIAILSQYLASARAVNAACGQVLTRRRINIFTKQTLRY